tara:strand:+ start:236 stop:652 length:417 start_codon:yes stop_codon:yes gene_type:complete
MKNYTLKIEHDYNFEVFAISSHSKAYKLCWHINKYLGLSLQLRKEHKVGKDLFFKRYESKTEEGCPINLISNHSKSGCLIKSHRTVNFFIIRSATKNEIKKDKFLLELKKINDILLVFELDLSKEKQRERLIIYDTKN